MRQIGVAFTDTSIQAVFATKKGKAWNAHATATVNLEQGVVHNGVVTDIARAAAALQQTLHTLRVRAPVVLCVPPCVVYATVTPVPNSMARAEHVVHEKLDALFPEPSEQLAYALHTFSRSPSEMEACVMAMRKDVLQGYLDVCAACSVVPQKITSSSVAIAGMCASDDALLVWKPTEDGAITLVHDGLPMDEAIVFSGTDASDIVTKVDQLRAEWPAAPRMYVAASSELQAKLEKLAASKKAKKGPAMEVVSLAGTSDDVKWLVAKSAAMADASLPAVYETAHSKTTAYVLTAAIIVALAATLWWLHTEMPAGLLPW